jgi:hypothetical protein
MSKLLAPNGKPSNLTPEQYKLVRTPAFKKWFGDWEKLENAKIRDSGIDEITLSNLSKNVSKVVDENGEPQIMLHGSNSKHFVFEINQKKGGAMGSGIYLTTDMIMANFYGSNVYDLFVNIKNPKYVNTRKEDTQMLGGSLIYLQKKGKGVYDGICNEYNIWLAINPNQIKLADGTNTTFDSINPDIRYEKGGETYSNTEKLIVELKKHSDYKKGKEGIDKETGQKYRHDRYILKYPFASYWLVKLWEKAAEENGDKYARNFIYNNKYSFAFDRGKFKGERDGRISLSELIELNDDYKQGGKLKTYWYKGLFCD